MEFDKNRVYTPVTSDQLKPGDKVIVANTIKDLNDKVLNDNSSYKLKKIHGTEYVARFVVESKQYHGWETYILAYLVKKGEV